MLWILTGAHNLAVSTPYIKMFSYLWPLHGHFVKPRVYHDKITCSPRQRPGCFYVWLLCITISIWVLMRDMCNQMIYGSRDMWQKYDSPSLKLWCNARYNTNKLYLLLESISPSSVIGPGFSSTSPDFSNKVIMSARDLTIIILLMEVSRLVCSNLTRVISIMWLLKSQIIKYNKMEST